MVWKSDLAFGQLMETKALDYIEYDYYETAPKDTYFPYWDIKAVKDGVITKYEVKADRVAIKTGNFLIEVKSRNRNSLALSEADEYILMICREEEVVDVFIVPIETLREEIDKRGVMVMGNSTVCLFPISELERLCNID